MDKLIVISGDALNQEFILDRPRMSVGRDQSNDICLGDKSVSRHHANVLKVLGQYFLEDARSTNGTRLNGREVQKHLLNAGDVIDIGKYKLRFQIVDTAEQEEDIDKTILMAPREKRDKPVDPSPASIPHRPTVAAKGGAHVRFLTGPNKGHLEQVDKSFFTVGQPGGDLILINRRHTGYFLLKMGGNASPSVNGAAVGAGGVELRNGDRVVLGDLDFEFVL
jgi:pSer/pThr/pTyr-binding forkhead associated (FHA) protein